MDIKRLIRSVAYIALAGALLATVVALNDRRYLTPSVSNGDPSPNAGTLDLELARCSALGAEAAQDTACRATWAANRERFLGSKKLYKDYITDAVSATAVSKQPASPSGEEHPPDTLQSPLTTDADASCAPEGTVGQSQ